METNGCLKQQEKQKHFDFLSDVCTYLSSVFLTCCICGASYVHIYTLGVPIVNCISHVYLHEKSSSVPYLMLLKAFVKHLPRDFILQLQNNLPVLSVGQTM